MNPFEGIEDQYPQWQDNPNKRDTCRIMTVMLILREILPDRHYLVDGADHDVIYLVPGDKLQGATPEQLQELVNAGCLWDDNSEVYILA